MFKPAPMKRIEVLILARDVRAVTEALGRLGVVHLSEAKGSETGRLVTPTRLENELSRIRSLLERVSALCDTLEVSEEHPAAELPYAGPDEVDAMLRPIEERLAALVERRKRLDAEVETEYQVLRDVEAYRPLDVSAEELRELDFLHFAVGTLDTQAVPKVREAVGERALILPFKSPDGQQRVVALAPRAGRFALNSILEEHGFRSELLPQRLAGAPADIVAKCCERLQALAREQEALHEETRGAAAEFGGVLAAYRARLRVDLQLLHAEAYFGRTLSTCFITGYVPSVRVDALRQELLRVTEGRVVVEVTDPPPDDPDIPTLMSNPKLLRPFEMLVAGYGQPGHREVEPTLFLAVSFLLMFGVMFGDVGHGAVVALAGALLARRGAGRARTFGALLAMAGGASVLCGWVFGSVFGVEGAIPPPWGGWFAPLKPQNITRLLVATIGLGVAMISLAIALNIVNRLRSREYFAAVVDRCGVVGFIFYWGALGLGVRAIVMERGNPSPVAVLLFVVLPLVVLFLREPLHQVLTRRSVGRPSHAPGLFAGLAEGFVEVIETVGGYLANTVSFVRVGAFALAHAALCVAVFTIERMVRSAPGGPLWSILVLVLGNALIIGLEGLVVSIQSMRLEYYEFLSKFFRGEGTAYQPFKLS